MKPFAFEYHHATTTEEACAILAAVGDDGSVLAGGQSLVPLMNFRLARPGHLVDINGINDLDQIEVSSGSVRVGARVRQSALENHSEARRICPLLSQALKFVAHPVVRNRGTVCGSIAHADPAAELCAVAALLEATVHLAKAGASGIERRDVAAVDFFDGPFQTTRSPEELVEAVTFPGFAPGRRAGVDFKELARRNGDYALSGVAALVEIDPSAQILSARCSYMSVGPTPFVIDYSDLLEGAPSSAPDWSVVGARARDQVRPTSDIHASADYRSLLAGVLTEDVLREALRTATS